MDIMNYVKAEIKRCQIHDTISELLMKEGKNDTNNKKDVKLDETVEF